MQRDQMRGIHGMFPRVQEPGGRDIVTPAVWFTTTTTIAATMTLLFRHYNFQQFLLVQIIIVQNIVVAAVVVATHGQSMNLLDNIHRHGLNRLVGQVEIVACNTGEFERIHGSDRRCGILLVLV